MLLLPNTGEHNNIIVKLFLKIKVIKIKTKEKQRIIGRGGEVTVAKNGAHQTTGSGVTGKSEEANKRRTRRIGRG